YRGRIRYPGQVDLDRDCDVTLDLLGRLAGVLGDDVDEGGHRIGIGFDIELDEARNADAEHEQQHQHHQHPPAQGEGDHGAHADPLRSVVTGGAVDEQCAAGHDLLAGGQAFEDLDHPIGYLPDPDGTGGDR